MRDYLTAIAPVLVDVAREAPFVGRTVQLRTKKNFGKTGVVVWHGADQFSTAGRYGCSATQHMREARGRWGYRVGVRLEDGSKVFDSAQDVIVCVESPAK